MAMLSRWFALPILFLALVFFACLLQRRHIHGDPDGPAWHTHIHSGATQAEEQCQNRSR